MHRTLSSLAGGVYNQIICMTPRQRRAALRELDKLSPTNCGWYLYEMRHVLREFIATASSRRCKVRRPK